MNKIISYLFYLFAILSALTFHSFWRDELQALSIVNASHSIIELLYNSRFEGHPIGWFLFLKIFTFISKETYILTLVNFIFAALIGFIIIFKSPLKLWQSVLLLLGYYFIFEYGSISRNYLPSIFFLFAFCWAQSQKNKFWLSVFLLASASQFNIYSAIIAIPLFIYFLFLKWKEFSATQKITFIIIILIAESISFYSCLPNNENTFSPLFFDAEFSLHHFILSIETIWKGVFPIPDFLKLHFWNTNIFENKHTLQAILSLLIIATCSIQFIKNKKLLLFFLITILFLFSFTFLQYIGNTRHSGFYFITILIFYWLYLSHDETKNESHFGFNALLISHFLMGVFFISKIISVPFSNAGNAAAYIQQYLPKYTICGATDDATSAIAGQLQQPIIFLNNFKKNTFVEWNNDRTYPSDSLLKEKILQLKQREKKLILVLNYPVQFNQNYELKKMYLQHATIYSHDSTINAKIIFQQSFSNAFVEDENYDVYLVE
ncbi:MAG: hypothetical protein RL065_2183 [Bacteroidota bacterium]